MTDNQRFDHTVELLKLGVVYSKVSNLLAPDTDIIDHSASELVNDTLPDGVNIISFKIFGSLDELDDAIRNFVRRIDD